MSDKYLLPCECGQSVAIGISEAGNEVTCTCGRKLPVPTLRGIRQLQRVQEASKKSSPAWNPAKGFIFAVGALLTAGGFIVAGHSYFVYTRVVDYKPSDQSLTESLQMIEEMDAVQMWDAWHFATQHGLEEPGTSDFAVAKSMAESKLRQTYVGLTVAIVGLFCIVVALFLPAGTIART